MEDPTGDPPTQRGITCRDGAAEAARHHNGADRPRRVDTPTANHNQRHKKPRKDVRDHQDGSHPRLLSKKVSEPSCGVDPQ